MQTTTENIPAHGLTTTDLPAIFLATDKSSLRGQHGFINQIRLQIIFLCIGAIAGVFTYKVTWGTTTTDLPGIVTAVAFLLTLMLQLFRFGSTADKIWYNDRAVAESTKTMAWRYAVGGNPFSVNVSEKDADLLLLNRLTDILHRMHTRHATGLLSQDSAQITAAMRQLRQQPLATRREAYAVGRIQDQFAWYTKNAQKNEQNATFWNVMLVVLESVGVIFALFKIVGLFQVDVFGIAGTLAGAVVTWMQMKQQQLLARSYSVTAMELAAIKEKIPYQQTEDDWAHFVDDAEAAISREHTLWLASRSAPNAED